MAYLLPCTQCGHKIAVTTGQAGERVRCQCGAAVDVPTVRGLRSLESAPDLTARSSNWTTRHSVVFLGIVLALLGAGLGVFFHLRANAALPRDTFADKILVMSPQETWELWSEYLRHGLGWQPQTGPQREAAIKRSQELRRWAFLGYGVGGIGVVVAIAGYAFLRPSPARKRPVSAAKRATGST